MSWELQIRFRCEEVDCESTETIWTTVCIEHEAESDSWNGTAHTWTLEPEERPEGWAWGFSPTRFLYGWMCPKCLKATKRHKQKAAQRD